jgi:hypothetical protein
MTKRIVNLKRHERKLEVLAQGETNIRERLLEMRTDLDVLMHTLDRLTCRQPRMHAGGGLLSGLNVHAFPRSRR